MNVFPSCSLLLKNNRSERTDRRGLLVLRILTTLKSAHAKRSQRRVSTVHKRNEANARRAKCELLHITGSGNDPTVLVHIYTWLRGDENAGAWQRALTPSGFDANCLLTETK